MQETDIHCNISYNYISHHHHKIKLFHHFNTHHLYKLTQQLYKSASRSGDSNWKYFKSLDGKMS